METSNGKSNHASASSSSIDEDAVEMFKNAIRIKSVSGDFVEYRKMCDFIKSECSKRLPGCIINEVEEVKDRPVVIVTLPGSHSSLSSNGDSNNKLPSIVLNSHYDVVPAFLDKWTVDPWAGYEDTTNGRIYGRGTQDMKCVLIQYILAAEKIFKKTGKYFLRDVYLQFVPDEEIGGKDGMQAFLTSDFFNKVMRPVALYLDEGLANAESGKVNIFYGERAPLWILIESTGPTGHGSRFIPHTAVEKLVGIANKAYIFRKQQEKLLGHSENGGCAHCEAKKLGEVTTLNLTFLRAGVPHANGETYAINVIPVKAEAGMDIRVSWC